MAPIVEEIVYQHVESAGGLWWQRHLACDATHYDFHDLFVIDDRVDAHLDGIRLAGHHARPIIDRLLADEDEGALFVAAVNALESRDAEQLINLMDLASGNKMREAEIDDALAWVNPNYLASLVVTLLEHANPKVLCFGLKACAAHGKTPERYLMENVEHDTAEVRIAVRRIAANLRNAAVLNALTSEDSNLFVEFENARALALLGRKHEACERLEPLMLNSSPVHAEAMTHLLLLRDITQGRNMLRKGLTDPSRWRELITGFGVLGDPAAVSWLIHRTDNDQQARLAGETIRMITGIDIDEAGLERDAVPAVSSAGPSDDPYSDEVTMEVDEDLPWPDRHKLENRWKSSILLKSGQSHLIGRPRTREACIATLSSARQPERHLAALVLALDNSRYPCIDTRLPYHRQVEQLHFLSDVAA